MNAKELTALFADRLIKPKDKVEEVAKALLTKHLAVQELVAFASTAKDTVRSSCIEAIERLASIRPEAVTPVALDFCIAGLAEKAPRIKWGSAKVVGHCINLYPKKVNEAVKALLDNTEHEGTVVRWSAANALSRVMAMGLPLNRALIPAMEAIAMREQKNSIRKILLDAINTARQSK